MFVKLSYPIYEEQPVCKGDPVITKFLPVTRIANGDFVNTTELHLFTHTGTHMDAPWHFNPKGRRVDELDVEEWVFNKPTTIDVSSRPRHDVDRSDIKPFFSKDDDSDFLLVFTGSSLMKERNTREYTDNFPGFTISAAKFIVEETKLRGVALDSMSIEPVENLVAGNAPVHYIMLGRHDVSKRSVVIIEEANILPILGKKLKRVFAVPLLLKGIDGSPVTMFAEIEE